jgi:threonine-phosphate decarboxylase
MLDFSNNVNFFGPPHGFAEIILAEGKKFAEYPEHLQKATRIKLAKIFNIAPESMALSIGATELLSIMPHLSKKATLIITPSFWEYEFFYAKLHGSANCKAFYLQEEQGFEFDYLAFVLCLSKEEIDICYLANPNNPTTTRLEKSRILPIIQDHPHILFVIDETYLPFSASYKQDSLFLEAALCKNLCVIASVSKIYSLPGIRVGFGISHPEIIEKIYQHLIPYGISAFSLAIIPWIFEQNKYLQDTQVAYHDRREYFCNRLNQELSNRVLMIDSGTAFVLIKIIPSLDEDMTESLAKLNLIVRGGKEFSELGHQWLRVSIRDFKKIDLLINGIKTILARQKLSNFFSLPNASNQQDDSYQKECTLKK